MTELGGHSPRHKTHRFDLMPMRTAAITTSEIIPNHQHVCRVTERVYVAHGYSISNIIFVVTATSVVVIDSGESVVAARSSLAKFRESCDLPISYIIYTHFHGDHIRGANAIRMPGTRIIAHRSMPGELARVQMLLPYRTRVDRLQFGLALDRRHRGVSHQERGESGFVPPDITFETEYKFVEGGIRFELYHAPENRLII